MKDVILTQEGYEKLKAEIEHLSTDKRREVADRIRTAREFGDITENAEYDDAKNEQAMLEHKIAQLEERLTHARVIETGKVDTSVVSVGAKVRLRDVDAKRTDEYFIVGSAEANPVRAEALQRVAGRQGDHRQEEGRDRRGQHAPRISEVQDPRHQSRVARTGRSARRASRSADLADDPALRAVLRTIPSGRAPQRSQEHATPRRLPAMLPKRFPDRDEIAAVRASAEALEAGATDEDSSSASPGG